MGAIVAGHYAIEPELEPHQLPGPVRGRLSFERPDTMQEAKEIVYHYFLLEMSEEDLPRSQGPQRVPVTVDWYEVGPLHSQRWREKPRMLQSGSLPIRVREFIQEMRFPSGTLQRLVSIRKKVSHFLENEGLEHAVEYDVAVDPEYPDWKEIEIVVKVRGDIEEVYREVRPTVYQLLEENLSPVVQEKTLIRFEMLH